MNDEELRTTNEERYDMITLYGTEWCEDTRRSRRLMRRLGVAHAYLDVDRDAEALERAVGLNNGRRRTPTIDLDGETLVEPSNAVLTAALVEHQRVPSAEEAAERLAIQNVGDLERALRAGTGLLCFALRSHAPRPLRPLVACAGLLAFFTGVAGWCPGYAATGQSSLDGPGDRPDEAERETWLTAPL